MTLDELLLEWSYRSEKGYPSLDNPSDILVLKKILSKLDLPTYDIIQQLKEQEDTVTIKTDDEIDDNEEFDSEEEQIPNEEPPGEKNNDDEIEEGMHDEDDKNEGKKDKEDLKERFKKLANIIKG